MILFKAVHKGVLILVQAPATRALLQARLACDLDDEGVLIRPPDVAEKVARAESVLRQRHMEYSIPRDLKATEVLEACESYLRGRIGLTEAIPWVEALEKVIQHPWESATTQMKVAEVLNRLGKMRFGDKMIVRVEAWEALLAGIESRELRIRQFMAELDEMRRQIERQGERQTGTPRNDGP